MIDGVANVALSPLLPWWSLAVLAVLGCGSALFGLWRGGRDMIWRLLAALVLLVGLANPSLRLEQREPLRDVAAVVVDDSASQKIGERAARATAALESLTAGLARYEDLDVRVVRVGTAAAVPDGGDGTRLFAAVERALVDVPASRRAGVIAVTDGQVHDAPDDGGEETGPFHLLLTGAPGEGDRRLVVETAPNYGIVGRKMEIKVRIDDLRSPDELTNRVETAARVTLSRDGEEESLVRLPIGRSETIELTLDRAGQTIFELEVEPGEQELSLANNRAVVLVNGVRDRLRVLLVTGEPHAGERTWRSLLKADPTVDLIHFTILRPPEKQDGTSVRELSLIAFPIRELFETRIEDFDLIIFDRYRRRGVLPSIYLQNIARYVRDGGALLEAAGPTFATRLSLYHTPLGEVLPGEPTGSVVERGYLASVTELGRRHPVTADLPGGGRLDRATNSWGTPSWGRWFRHIDVEQRSGVTLLGGVDAQPLLILDRVGEGRVAQLLSDHMWLWARGFDGGGPQAELLRRLAHWLMKEPDLEEIDLRARVEGDRLELFARRMAPGDIDVEITTPSGEVRMATLSDAGDGRSTGAIEIGEPGLYRVSDGARSAIAAAGALNPVEQSDLRTTDRVLGRFAEASGGGTFWLAETGVPDTRRSKPDRAMHGVGGLTGAGWLGLRETGSYLVTGVQRTPLLPAALILLLTLGGLIWAWYREGR